MELQQFKVELVDTEFEVTDENLKTYLGTVSSVVRNKQPTNNERLHKRLLKEAYGNTASRVLEYLPVILNKKQVLKSLESADIQLFGFFIGEVYYTNTRELLNWGTPWEDIIPYVSFAGYKTVKVTAPYFLYGQLSTHTQITTVSHSNRYTEANLGYWCPPEYFKWKQSRNDKLTNEDIQELWNHKVLNSSPIDLEQYMKKVLGIVRREISARGADALAIRVYTLGGYTQTNGWRHFLRQRGLDAHTQLELRELTDLIGNEVLGDNWKEILK